MTLQAAQDTQDSAIPVPATRQDPVQERLHGVEMVDPYRWLEDQNSPETRAWINAQNAYTHAVIGTLPGRDAIQQRLTELMKIDSISMPILRGGRAFFMRRKGDEELSVILMRESLDGEDRILIDPHPMSADHTTSVQLGDVAEDGKLFAYFVRVGGEDETTVRLMDVDACRDLPDVLPRARYFGVSIKPDNSGFYYTRHEAAGPRVYYHAMGTPVDSDVRIFGDGYGPEKIISAGLSQDGRMLMITVSHGAGARRTEVYFQDVWEDGPVTTLVNDLEAQFYASYVDDRFYIQTDWNAPRGRILAADLANLGPDRWREIVPASDEVIQGFSLVGGKLFVNSLRNVATRLRELAPDGTPLREVDLPGIGSASGMVGRWKDQQAFFGFSSFHIPWTIFRYDVETGATGEWARQEVPIDSSRFQVEQVWVQSKDGVRLPMFVVSARALERDGRNPTFLTGYGGFNASLTPGFSAIAALWIENGGVYAVPNLRGGGEFGEDWHRAGMREQKQNVFNDFIAAAEWLIAEGYTSPSRLAIIGGSNGGLLVGACMTQRPDLYRAIVCTYPLLDMVRYHRFLVAGFWTPEYGSSENPEQFQYLHAYSPYHRVRPGTRYPAVLFMTGDGDTRVDPLHARKMAALLQSATGSGPDRPILLHYDIRAGHSGGKPLTKVIQDLTDELAFLFWQLRD